MLPTCNWQLLAPVDAADNNRQLVLTNLESGYLVILFSWSYPNIQILNTPTSYQVSEMKTVLEALEENKDFMKGCRRVNKKRQPCLKRSLDRSQQFVLVAALFSRRLFVCFGK